MLRIVNTTYGPVRGTWAADPRITSFKGIPFAAPPVGELRWRAPRAPKSWSEVKDCIEYAPISMQNIPGVNKEQIYSKEWNVDPTIPMSEDCLYLNVWTPANSEEDNLPVYVWYFGGALQFGNTAEMEFDGERIARRGIVVVTVNYRINVFGFMTHPLLQKEDPQQFADFGNLDQQFGLKWTYENIKAFGGNPENITIGGQSAGGGSVLTQLNCPDNRKYIKKAVIESGMFLNPYKENPYMSLDVAFAQGQEFFDYLGVKTLEEARALPAEYLRDKNDAFGKFWWTVTDGIFQKDNYLNHLMQGKLLDVPMLIGDTPDEFLELPPIQTREELDALVKARFPERAKEFFELLDKDTSTCDLAQKAGVRSMRIALLTALKKMEQNEKKTPLYVYEFDPFIPGEDNPGAFHSSDLWFFFETLAKCWRPFTGKHYDLARQMCNYLCNFIKDGDPNGFDSDGTKLKQWEPYEKDNKFKLGFYDEVESRQVQVDELTQFFVSLYN